MKLLNKIQDWSGFLLIYSFAMIGAFDVAGSMTKVAVVQYLPINRWQGLAFLLLVFIFICWSKDIWTWFKFWNDAEWED